MRTKRIVKTGIDILMLIFLPLLMAYSLIGEVAHEWLGLAMFLLFLLHHILNPSWLKNFFKGRYTPYRIYSAVVNVSLLIIMFLLPVSGILMSKHIFRFTGMKITAYIRHIHLFAAYWGFVLMSVHLGNHVGRNRGNTEKKPKFNKAQMVLLLLAALICGYGVCAIFRHNIGSYLFLQNQFVFFDFRESRLRFFADYAAMIWLFACCGYVLSVELKSLYCTKGCKKVKIKRGATEKSMKLTELCNHCNKCSEVCPAGIDIPAMLQIYDQYKNEGAAALKRMDAQEFPANPQDCIECGACSSYCPKKIPVKKIIRELAMLQCK